MLGLSEALHYDIAVLFNNSLTDDRLNTKILQLVTKRPVDILQSWSLQSINDTFSFQCMSPSIHSSTHSMSMMMRPMGKCVFAASKGIVVCLI